MEGRRIVLDFRERERQENFILFHSLGKKGQSRDSCCCLLSNFLIFIVIRL